MRYEESGWKESAPGWIEQIERGDWIREKVADRTLLDLLGDIRGLDVLDVGCGEGRFCRMMAERGAQTVGVDPTELLLERAATLHPQGRYLRGLAGGLPLKESAFDVAISYLVLLDVPDYRQAVAEMHRVLRPGGRCLFVGLHPIRTAAGPLWIDDPETGRHLAVPVAHYSFEWCLKASWGNISIVNYHRPLGEYMSAFLEAGFVLKSFLEPVPDGSGERDSHEIRVPLTLVMEWAKTSE